MGLVNNKVGSFFVMVIVILTIPHLYFSMEMQIKKSKIRFLRFDGLCKRSPDTAITFNLKSWRIEGKYLILNSTFDVARDIGDVTMRMILQKCRSKENPDSCQNVYTMTNKNACQLFEVKSALWTPVLEKISPEWKCPLRKGTYSQTDSRFDISPVLFFPIEEWYWKSNSEFLDKQGRILFCIDAFAKVTKMD